MLIFAATVGITLLVGLIYLFAQPVTYRTEATLRIAVGSLADSGELSDGYSVADLDALLSQNLFVRVRGILEENGQLSGDRSTLLPADLRAMVDAAPAGGKLVKLYARGGDAGLLPPLLEAWAWAFKEGRESTGESRNTEAFDKARRQKSVLEDKLAAKRREMVVFQERYDIVSLQRDENQVLIELKQLTNALGAARQREAGAGARLQAVLEGAREGHPVLLPEDRRLIRDRRKTLVKLDQQIEKLKKRYTRAYLKLNPVTRDLDERRDTLTKALELAQREAAQAALDEARREQRTAASERTTLASQVREQKTRARKFSAQFARYQALSRELEQLEGYYKDIQQQVVAMDVHEGGMQTRVVLEDPPYQPEYPERSGFWVDLIKLALLALVLGLAAAKLYEYLTRPPPPQDQASAIQIFQHIGQPSQAAVAQGPTDPVLSDDPATRLGTSSEHLLGHQETGLPRELAPSEVAALVGACYGEGRLVLLLLILGLSVEEIVALYWRDVDLAGGVLRVAGRDVPLSPPVRGLLGELVTAQPDAGEYLLPTAEGGPRTLQDLDAVVACAAHDAGLAQAGEVDAASLRCTYILYLVRQGAGLGGLARWVGTIPAPQLRNYAPFSPPGPARPADEVEPFYPLS